MSPKKGSGKSNDTKDDVWALGGLLVGGVLGRPREDFGLNTIGIFALKRPGVEALIADARRASPDLGSLGDCDGCGGRERKEGAKRVQRMLYVLAWIREKEKAQRKGRC